jgi:hypothetical protein
VVNPGFAGLIGNDGPDNQATQCWRNPIVSMVSAVISTVVVMAATVMSTMMSVMAITTTGQLDVLTRGLHNAIHGRIIHHLCMLACKRGLSAADPNDQGYA